MDVAIALAWLPRLIQAAALTIALAAIIFALSGIIALALALIGYGKQRPRFVYALEGFSAVFRSIPELVILFLFYFGGVQLGLDFGPVGSTILAFGLVGIAYDYQVFKGALSAVPYAQFEAGRALALPTFAIYWRILLPQVLPLAKPGWITYAIGTVKRVSIASAVSVSEILYVTKQAIAATNAPFVFLALAVALYIIIATPLIVWNEFRFRRRPA